MKIDTPEGPVSARFDVARGARAMLVLGNGAGPDMSSEFMKAFADGLEQRGCAVCRFNFVYQEQRRKSPDRQPILERTYEAVVEVARQEATGLPLFMGGKSMGGRIASHLAASGAEAAGLVFLGYPLHPPGRPDRIRDDHLYDIRMPMLFVEGTRDPFCPLDALEKVRTKIGAPNEIFVVEDGDHSLKVRKSSGRTTPEAWSEAMDAIAAWIAKNA